MHDRLGKSSYWERHVSALIEQAGRRRFNKSNVRFGLINRNKSPAKLARRKRLRESILGMMAGAYAGSSAENED